MGPSWREAPSPASFSPTSLLLVLVMVRDKCCLLAGVSENSLTPFPQSAFSLSVDITPWSSLEAIRFFQLGGNETFAMAEWA